MAFPSSFFLQCKHGSWRSVPHLCFSLQLYAFQGVLRNQVPETPVVVSNTWTYEAGQETGVVSVQNSDQQEVVAVAVDDIDGCLNPEPPCFEGVDCTDDNSAASSTNFTCGACPPGFEGDGVNCTDIDGCVDVTCFNGTCVDRVCPLCRLSC